MEELPDIKLEDLRANDAAAWNLAQPALWERCWRAALKKLPFATQSELEDLLSDVLCGEVIPQVFEPKQEDGAFARLQTFEDLVNLACNIVSRRAIDRVRQSMRRGEHVDVDAVPEMMASSGPPTEEREQADAVRFAMRELTEREHTVIRLHYFDGLSTLEVAEKTGNPKGTVVSDLSRGRAKMREKLEREGILTGSEAVGLESQPKGGAP
ncbi:MAG: RNA polymerase sigma factor (sigma-70 family) [Verrucomicrobiales bacterium]|jgi:RNA polymerase sigma factor (sigma-70 family)